jgi:hypothetical protein
MKQWTTWYGTVKDSKPKSVVEPMYSLHSLYFMCNLELPSEICVVWRSGGQWDAVWIRICWPGFLFSRVGRQMLPQTLDGLNQWLVRKHAINWNNKKTIVICNILHLPVEQKLHTNFFFFYIFLSYYHHCNNW